MYYVECEHCKYEIFEGEDIFMAWDLPYCSSQCREDSLNNISYIPNFWNLIFGYY
jgi:hypothetical protein